MFVGTVILTFLAFVTGYLDSDYWTRIVALMLAIIPTYSTSMSLLR